jgi:hypothetical protein
MKERISQLLNLERKISMAEMSRGERLTSTELQIRWYELRHDKPCKLYRANPFG